MSTVARERDRVTWVDCFGSARVVVDGRVACPLQDRTIAVGTCLDCRHLSATADERHGDRDCRIPDRIG